MLAAHELGSTSCAGFLDRAMPSTRACVRATPIACFLRTCGLPIRHCSSINENDERVPRVVFANHHNLRALDAMREHLVRNRLRPAP